MTHDQDTILSARNLKKTYKMGRFPVSVLRGASIEVKRGEFVAVMGRSGSGKSTLLHVMGALEPPDKGNITLNGQDLFALSSAEREIIRNRDVGFVFQFYHLMPELTVLENVLTPSMVGNSVISWLKTRKKARLTAHEMLERFDIHERARHRPRELSGGERQRVAIARALMNQPQLLLADEPTGNLDRSSGRSILDLLIALNRSGQTIVMVTHDADIATLADRCVYLKEGKVADSA